MERLGAWLGFIPLARSQIGFPPAAELQNPSAREKLRQLEPPQ